MFYVHQHRSCINARSPLATLADARQYVASAITSLRHNGLSRPGSVWVIVDADGNPVERITEGDKS